MTDWLHRVFARRLEPVAVLSSLATLAAYVLGVAGGKKNLALACLSAVQLLHGLTGLADHRV